MLNRTPGLLLVVVAMAASFHAQAPSGGEWQRADDSVVRLSPSSFGNLPAAVVRELARRGCTIPQASFWRREPHNVIRGAFTRPGREDIAVLCSRNRLSSILVFRAGSTVSVGELADRPDFAFLQVAGVPREIAFSRVIDVVDARHMRTLGESHEATTSAALDHAGIRDAFIEKASVVWYWDRDHWLQLAKGN